MQSLQARVELGVIAMNRYLSFTTAPGLEPQMQFSVLPTCERMKKKKQKKNTIISNELQNEVQSFHDRFLIISALELDAPIFDTVSIFVGH